MIRRLFRPDAFAGHLLAYGASEAAAKISRLFVVIAVARTLEPAAIGVAAAALAGSDLLKALTENGVGQRIIAASERDLAATCRTARRIFWAWCLGLAALQTAVALAIWAWTGAALLPILLVILAAEYLFMPPGLVQCALAMREGRMRQTAAIAGAQVVGANLATVVLTLVWPSAIALVLPKLIAAPIWSVAMRRLCPWQPDRTVPAAPLRPFLRFGAPVLGVEIVRALRLQADKLLVGALLGAEALGLYFMAFNAGLGLTTSFGVAFSTVLFPHLCRAREPHAALREALGFALLILAPVVCLQALAAPLYVPLLYGSGWEEISPVVSILCLAAIPGLIWAAAAQFLRAADRPAEEFHLTALTTAALMVSTLAMAGHGLVALATGYLLVATMCQVGGAAFVLFRHARLAPRGA